MKWKDIEFNNKYEVSDTGLVRRKDSGHILQGCIAHGYRSVKLTFENSRQQRFKVHRLVALHFIENPDPKRKTLVNHKDGNKLNNNVDNLEWVTPRENNLHYYRELQKAKKEKKQGGKPVPVNQYNLEGKFIASYPSISAASKATSISIVHIARNVHEETKNACGYIFISQ